MGTAATYSPDERRPYENNAEDGHRLGNEGFNLDPPCIDLSSGEAAKFPDKRSAVDLRHLGRASVLWVDGHTEARRPEELGYRTNFDGSYAWFGNNSLWTGTGRDVPWSRGLPQ